jgi:two-component system sensor histidine kinase MtrB
MRYVGWLDALRRFGGFWRSSLSVRTVATTILLSSLAVGVFAVYVTVSIRDNLFDQGVQQALSVTERAAVSTQNRFSLAEGTQDFNADAAFEAAYASAALLSSTSSGSYVAMLRSDAGARSGPTPRTSPGFGALISDELRERVAGSGEDPKLYWQSVALPGADGPHPGVVVGAVFDVPLSGQYELYIAYDLVDTQQTLDVVVRTILLGGAALVLLIGAVTYVVVRLVVAPVRTAAETSERLAAGELDIRIPVHGDDVIATLARSFNGMAASLQRQITRLATLSQVQQRFVSDVSHELRTPLTTIRLAGDVLYDSRSDFDPTTARTVELLHTQVQRFELLLADLLEMSRYDAGAVEMDVEPTNLVRLAEDAMEAVSSLASAKGSELRLVAPGGYFQAEVDSRRIRRILTNLLGNAIDHGEGKPIVVYIDSDETAVAVAVRDYGVGMTPESVERVFDRFWRADPSRQRTTGGSGLGLAISLEDAALHGGWLEVWSAPGDGSCFRLTLPRRHGAELHSSPLELPPSEQGSES